MHSSLIVKVGWLAHNFVSTNSVKHKNGQRCFHHVPFTTNPTARASNLTQSGVYRSCSLRMWLHRARLHPPSHRPYTILDAMRYTLQQQRLPLCTRPSRPPTFQTRAPTPTQRAAALAVSDEHSSGADSPADDVSIDRLPRAVVPGATSVGARLAAASTSVR